MDWKDSLASLMADMPEDETAAIHAEPAETPAPESVEKARLDILLDKKGRRSGG